ncbi:hypothetical protein [Pseudonocardia sp. SID8383]|uniref:hypothetical protein n=1 Tax=Pseudonocardia sp. SID8383 TaxID=2690363 RepID=UPI000AA3E2D6|nr:hypothetical protein [Pseudonocardia sp. SID8383]
MRGDDDAVESTRSDLVHAAMAAHDWSSHPLGPPERWSPDLRSVVRMLLDSRFSMWMAWGPDLTMFYNDAYRGDTLRDKHPWALGRSAREVWAEVWDDVGPLIGSVLAGGGATWDEDLLLFLERSGHPEETYHTFSYSPLHEDGAIAGMLCVVTENTDRVLSERRMQTLRDLAADLGPTRTGAQVYAAVGRALAGNLASALDEFATWIPGDRHHDCAGCPARTSPSPGPPGSCRRCAAGSGAGPATWAWARTSATTWSARSTRPPPTASSTATPSSTRPVRCTCVSGTPRTTVSGPGSPTPAAGGRRRPTPATAGAACR